MIPGFSSSSSFVWWLVRRRPVYDEGLVKFLVVFLLLPSLHLTAVTPPSLPYNAVFMSELSRAAGFEGAVAPHRDFPKQQT